MPRLRPAEARHLLHPFQDLRHVQAMAQPVFLQPRQGGGPDPAPGHVDHALEAEPVPRVGDEPQVGDHVLDLFALVELQPPHHGVGDVPLHEGVLEDPGLGVGAVEHREVGPPAALGEPAALDLLGHVLGLAVLVPRLEHPDLLTPAEPRPKRTLPPHAVTGDHLGRHVQDALGGPVVLLQLDHPRLRVVRLEVQDVGDVGAAEGVDRLVGVPHNRHVAVQAAQELDQPVLGVVRILVLVDKDMEEPLLVVIPRLGVALQHLDRVHDEVPEVQGVVLMELPLIEFVDLGHLQGTRVARPPLELLRPDEGVLRPADGGGDPARGPAFVVPVELFEAFLDERGLVVGVEDDEVPPEPDALGVAPQHAGAGGMEGARPQVPGGGTHERLEALQHLARRLIGEGDAEDAEGAHPLLDEPGRAPGQDARLAAPRPGQDEERTAGVTDRLALRFVEIHQQVRLRTQHALSHHLPHPPRPRRDSDVLSTPPAQTLAQAHRPGRTHIHDGQRR